MKKKKGTTFNEMQSLFIDQITTKFIQEPIYSCELKDEASKVKKELHKMGFNVAGVKNDKEKVIGFIEREELEKGRIENFMKKIALDHVASDSTPISKLLSVLYDKPFVFTLYGNKIEGIVTRSDVNKPIVRIYIFGIITLFEMHLNSWIKEYYLKESWKDKISEKRVKSAKGLFAKKKGDNTELSLLECIQFCDKRDILKSTSKFLEKFDYPNNKFVIMLKKLEKIRNELAHSQKSILLNLEWKEFSDTITFAEDFLFRSDNFAEIEK